MKTDETKEREVELVTFSVPSETSARRITGAIAECVVNTPDDSLEGRTPWEALRGSAARAKRWLETRHEAAEIKAVVQRLLDEVDSPGRLTVAFERSGGLLNLFNEPPAVSDDDIWETLRAQHGERDAAEQWNRTPNPLFAELTPAEVWAGGGVRERELLTNFLRSYSSFALELDPPSRGAFVKRTCSFLHTWTIIPRQGKRTATPRAEICQERRAILARKLTLLSR